MREWKNNWEIVNRVKNQEFTDRMKVPGGWIVRTRFDNDSLPAGDTPWQVSVAITFLPDPDYEWAL